MEAYRATFKGRNDVIVLDSNSEFFKYFKGPGSRVDGCTRRCAGTGPMGRPRVT